MDSPATRPVTGRMRRPGGHRIGTVVVCRRAPAAEQSRTRAPLSRTFGSTRRTARRIASSSSGGRASFDCFHPGRRRRKVLSHRRPRAGSIKRRQRAPERVSRRVPRFGRHPAARKGDRKHGSADFPPATYRGMAGNVRPHHTIEPLPEFPSSVHRRSTDSERWPVLDAVRPEREVRRCASLAARTAAEDAAPAPAGHRQAAPGRSRAPGAPGSGPVRRTPGPPRPRRSARGCGAADAEPRSAGGTGNAGPYDGAPATSVERILPFIRAGHSAVGAPSDRRPLRVNPLVKHR